VRGMTGDYNQIAGEKRRSQMVLEKLFGRKRKVVIYTQPT